MLKISVITVCFNSAQYIRDAIGSVLEQTYTNIEYIVIDGASTDGTADIVRSYGNKVHHFVSEKDKGLYDAMNKGLKLASGDYLCILNSDDFYIRPTVIQEIVDQLNSNKTDCIYADLIYVKAEDTNKQVRYWRSGKFIPGSFRKGWHPPHPTFIVKNSIYKEFGYFDLTFKLAADFELMLRFLEKHKISTHYYDKPLIKMRLGGTTNKSISNIYKQNIECFNAFKYNGIPVSILYPFYRTIPKITQYFRKRS